MTSWHFQITFQVEADYSKLCVCVCVSSKEWYLCMINCQYSFYCQSPIWIGTEIQLWSISVNNPCQGGGGQYLNRMRKNASMAKGAVKIFHDQGQHLMDKSISHKAARMMKNGPGQLMLPPGEWWANKQSAHLWIHYDEAKEFPMEWPIPWFYKWSSYSIKSPVINLICVHKHSNFFDNFETHT